MIIINDATLFCEIKLKKEALARDEEEKLVHDPDGNIERSFARLNEIISNNEVYGYVFVEEVDNILQVFMSGFLQDTIIKETIDILKSLVSLSRQPFSIEQLIEGSYNYIILFDEDINNEDDAKALDCLIQAKDFLFDSLLELNALPVKFKPELKKIITANEKFFNGVEVQRILPTIDIMEAIYQMQEETQNG